MIECKDCNYKFKIKDIKKRYKDCFGYYWFCPECGLLIDDEGPHYKFYKTLMIAYREVKRQELMKQHKILDTFF
jgi:hypothetical protein